MRGGGGARPRVHSQPTRLGPPAARTPPPPTHPVFPLHTPHNPPLQVSQFTTLATHYPKRLDRAYLLNPTALVRIAWGLVSPFLSPATRKSIQFAPMEDTAGFLRRELGGAGLQKKYGGRREDFDSEKYLARES